MVEGRTADARLERLLHILPAASRTGGATLEELARALDTTPRRIVEDLEEATTRIYYHPGGWPEDLRLLLDGERVRVVHAHGLERPVRLNDRELLCLALALRGGAAAARLRDDETRLELLRRAEAHLARGPGGGGGKGAEGEGAAGGDGGSAGPVDPAHPPMEAPDRTPDPEGIRETILSAARTRTPCAVQYLKDGAEDAEARVLHPYVVAYADGAWYTVGWCAVREGVRVFRLDRILEAAPCDGTFERPEDFDPSRFFGDGTVYDAPADREVRVRYSPRVARWVRERAAFRAVEVEEDGEGGVIVRHRVADPRWVVSHALQYGAEAEILGPPEMRARVRAVVEEMGG